MEKKTFNEYVLERVKSIDASFDTRRDCRAEAFTKHEVKIEEPKVTDAETYTDTEVKVRVTAESFDHTAIAAIANVVDEKPVWVEGENKEFFNTGFISANEGGGIIAIIVFTELVFKSKKGGAQ